MTSKHYLVRSYSPKDKAEVDDIIFNRFDADEPLVQGILNKSEIINSPVEEFEAAKADCNSLVAVEDGGKIIGLAINDILDDNRKDVMYSQIENCSDMHIQNAIMKIYRFLDYVGLECKMSARFPHFGKGVLLDKLYVDPSQRGKGIAKALINETRNVAKRNGCNYIKVIATSFYSALALERVGFQKIYSIDYKDYKVNGEVVFKMEPPHTSLAVYIQQVDDRG